MTLVSKYDEIEAGRIIKESKAEVIAQIDTIRILMDEIAGFKTSYPTASEEIDGYVTDLKTALNNLIKRYEK